MFWETEPDMDKIAELDHWCISEPYLEERRAPAENTGPVKGGQTQLRFDHPTLHHSPGISKSVLQLDHVAKTVVRHVNCIRTRGLNHLQFIQLEESETEHTDVPWEGVMPGVGVERRDMDVSGNTPSCFLYWKGTLGGTSSFKFQVPVVAPSVCKL